MKKTVLVSVFSDLYTDQRVKRSCSVLTDLGFDVLAVARFRNLHQISGTIPHKVIHIKLPVNRGFLCYALFNIRLFFLLLRKKADVLLANDLDTLLPNYLASRIKRIPLVYDSHEYFTGVPEIQNKPFVKWVWKSIEKRIFPHLKDVFTVNDSIASLYEKDYGKRPLVLRNIPALQKPGLLKSREDIGWPSDKRIVILQGTGINIQRGAEEAVEAFLPEYGLQNTMLYIIGDGDVIPALKLMVDSKAMSDRVKFMPRMPAELLQHYTANANLGLTLDKDTNINYRYSLPNKLFDYIHAGIPVLASELTELKRVIDTYKVGRTIRDITPRTIAHTINEMLSDEIAVQEWKKNTILAAQELNWEAEKNIITDVFKKFL